jgi:cytochrome P450
VEACVGGESVADTIVRFFSQDARADPYGLLRQIRDAGPLHRTPLGVYLVTRYADCAGLLQNSAWSHAAEAALLHPGVAAHAAATELPASFLWMDPPDHTRLRNLVSKAFTTRTVTRLRPRIHQLAGQLVDAALDAREVDLIDAIAYPLPLTMVCELVGVPAEAHASIRTWASALARGFDPDILLTPQERADRSAAARDFMAYFRTLIDERRRRPADDLLSALAAVEDRGDVLTENELLATCVTLIVAGHETSVNLIGNGLLALMRDQDALTQLRRQPELVPAAVEELLRCDPPAMMTTRAATRPMTVAGHAFAPGDGVVVLICSANRDERVFAEPERLDVRRYYDRESRPARHLAFSLGIHYCLGAPDGISPRLIMAVRASGMDAADVLPEWTMSVATLAWGAPSLPAIDSMMRRFAWCGTNAASSLGAIPAAAHARLATGCSAVVAQRNTAWPSCVKKDRRSLMMILSRCVPSLPQITGPIPGRAVSVAGPTTAAPAPSAKMTHVLRSVQSIHCEYFSAPITSAYREVPARTASLPAPSA